MLFYAILKNPSEARRVMQTSETSSLISWGRCKRKGGSGAQPRKILKFYILKASGWPNFDTSGGGISFDLSVFIDMAIRL